ncbi:hypothetical protein ILUMI_25434 [Ignelater luminosus]|uniref:Uncharacterized protein n=1 Tax=Ignelater luminosus TaxID=2038154 RepID=A0A8K0C5K1_IGNLU|nr:hypothetical protein ILUMI_25434 [Ignelater luminosus]
MLKWTPVKYEKLVLRLPAARPGARGQDPSSLPQREHHYHETGDDYDNKILELMAQDDQVGEDVQETEFHAQKEYRKSYRIAKIKVEIDFEKQSSVIGHSDAVSRSVEFPGVTREKYVAMLFPLVESSLPDETLQAWQRSYMIQDTKSDKLANLISFLKGEVDEEKRIKLARNSFTSGPEAKNEISENRFIQQWEDVALSVGAVFVKDECLAQAVFGESVTPVRPINKYKFTLQFLNGATSQEIETLSQKKIFEYIPKLHSSPWLRKLSDGKIWINDMTNGSSDVDIVIGCDYYSNSLTRSTVMETISGPVFDASAGRPLLNDHLEKGPNLLQLIPSLILKSREKQFGLVVDIRREFMMIKVNLKDRDFLRFLWWKSEYATEMLMSTISVNALCKSDTTGVWKHSGWQ